MITPRRTRLAAGRLAAGRFAAGTFPARAGALLAMALPALSALPIAAVRAQSAPAPAPLQAIDFRTPDGSRCLLVADPRPDAPALVSWAVVAPCGLAEDPAGQLGLSRALVRASLNGTVTRGSRDWALERDALRALDNAQAAALAAPGAPGPDLLAELLASQKRVLELGDRDAWRRELSAAPAVDLHTVDTPRATVLQLTTEASALAKIARLLWDRRENPAFRGIHEALARHRVELRRAQLEPGAALRREVLGLSFLGDPGSRTLQTRPGSFTREELFGLWRNIAHPSRTTHVITGSFDPSEVRELLDKAFARTELAAITAPEPPAAGRTGERSSRITAADGHHGAVVGLVMPTVGADPAELNALAAWLGDPSRQPLRRSLINAGYLDPHVQVWQPFPDTARPGLFLVQFDAIGFDPAVAATARRQPAPNPSSPTIPASKPGAALQAALRKLLENDPTAAEFKGVAARQQSEHAAMRTNPATLAEYLARACGIGGMQPTTALAPIPTPEPTAARALLQRLWNEGPRTVVEQVPGQ